MVTRTTHFRFGIPDFTVSPWHADWYTLVQAIDRALYEVVIESGGTIWANSTAYTIGSIVISPIDGTLWSAAIAHTSSATPTTFDQERVANPTFWNTLAATTAADVEFDPAGTLASTNVQDAIEELLAETQPIDADLTALAGLATTGYIARTGVATYALRTVGTSGAGLSGNNTDGVAGNTVIALADDAAAIEALAANGIACRINTSTWAVRTLQQPAAGITITNPAGTAGDPTLALADDLAAVEGLGATGLSARIGASSWTTRTLTGPAAGVSVSNGDGVAGNPTIALANDLAALEAMASTGLVARTASETYAQRTITGPAAGISVSNGDGIAGNPTLALANDLAALEAMSGTGIAVHTGVSTWTERTITGPAAGISVSNGSGVSGNPTLALANDLAALEAMAGTGIVARTASETYAQRTITGTAAEIDVTNGNGVSGNPTLSLPASLTFTGKTITGGTYTSVVNVSLTGYIDITEAAAPANPAANVARLYCRDDAGTTRLYFRDSAGTESVVGGGAGGFTAATQAEQETGTSTTVGVTPGRQQFHASAAKFWGYATVSGGTPTLQSPSHNITSITDTATGRLTVTIATDFSTANWAASADISFNTGTTGRLQPNYASKAAGSFILESYDTADALTDPLAYDFIGYGDQ